MSIDFNVDQAIEKIGQLVQAHGQQAVDAASAVVQVNALDTLSGIPGYGIVAAACGWFLRHSIRKAASDDGYGDAPLGWTIGAIISGFAALGFGVASLTCAFSVWSWVALFNPHLALAHVVMQRLGAP